MDKNDKKMTGDERDEKIKFIIEGLKELGCFINGEAGADSLFSFCLAQQKSDESDNLVEV